MLSFSLNEEQMTYLNSAVNSLNGNIGYIRKFNSRNYEEAISTILDIAMRNRKDGYSNMNPYVKKIARHVPTKVTTELSFDTLNEDGEVAAPYLSLVKDDCELIEVNIDKRIYSYLDEMYLIDPEYVISLRNAFFADNKSEKELRQYKPVGDRMRQLWQQLMEVSKYPVFNSCITEFYMNLQNKGKKAVSNTVKEIKIKDISYDILDLLPDESVLIDKNGVPIEIDRNTLYSEVELDMEKWSIKGRQAIGIQKIDISEYMDYIYTKTFVERGVNNSIITWAIGDSYKLMLPSGLVRINEAKEKFIDECYRELFLNILNANIGVILGATADSIYIRKRGVGIKTLRCITAYNKTFDLDVSTIN